MNLSFSGMTVFLSLHNIYPSVIYHLFTSPFSPLITYMIMLKVVLSKICYYGGAAHLKKAMLRPLLPFSIIFVDFPPIHDNNFLHHNGIEVKNVFQLGHNLTESGFIKILTIRSRQQHASYLK